MRFKRLKPYEQEFVSLNTNILEITYYIRKAKTHKAMPSVFRITRGYAFYFLIE